MHELNKILQNVSVKELIGKQNLIVGNIIFDSRKVDDNCIFVAVSGTQVDGHDFIEKAIQGKAIVIVCEVLPERLHKGVTYIKVSDSNEALGVMSSNFYGNPSGQLKLIGITGTNGKTTTVTLLHDLFSKMGYKVGLLSTVENKIGDKIIPSTHTTPDAVVMNELISDMVDAGCDYAFMEVSSHAIHQRRIAGLTFAGGVFTNISHDHLDYHKTFKEYLNAKKKFFDDLPEDAFALINLDDRNGMVMVQNTRAKIQKYSLRKKADFKVKIVDNSLSGLHLEINDNEFFGRLIGEFNAYNLLSAYAVGVLLEKDSLYTLTILSQLKSAEGRFDYIKNEKTGTVGIVDYAHTPDALEKVLSTIEKLKTGNEQIITVVGCGGDRDKAKRPVMAKMACAYSNHVIITSDNPRTENPDEIIEDMMKGVPIYSQQKVLTIPNRLQAIKTASRIANNGDLILVAGKGHEKYQDIKGVKYEFDDKQVLGECLKG
ncbi:MAG: UDP-N-acetylmuramoyl-L-alanyl-D-glutamate--2,6-diaminopimelate ligase [Saprospiraceae bacterium]|nr:UDP-N-acetylmuramoyl-L-alanyl-D-glutamate--2,6-diaminopimelate ligase [bacterium]MDB4442900.1 UDP-N-acetylmuramoyl-L-alanyl-D-glutamate--2,6-diaminopimelate ligase [Saprospiraceae bacterium]MDB4505557.1 UDP-N-acetylmuramoyl-L-alanyl-D-glutamate--2,6-diaminopimelate ligase [Saprospiraceae bacterium]MDG1435416.1 UDP-N-acetylmuramoyl-L-alanyl-D-glutamate--2,6-diaminopimelate ligase [Saprospiraceae bacterium]MDG2417736.1 UDP-N-acetylmuramoyl-L-alanyl-D-glutamate--2,6-diaminopimelate ligase [Sapr